MQSIDITKNNYKELYTLLQKWEEEVKLLRKKNEKTYSGWQERFWVYLCCFALLQILVLIDAISYSNFVLFEDNLIPFILYSAVMIPDCFGVLLTDKIRNKKLEKKYGYTNEEMDELKERFEELGIIKYDGIKRVFCGDEYEKYCSKAEEIKKSITKRYESYSYNMYISEEKLNKATSKVKVLVKK